MSSLIDFPVFLISQPKCQDSVGATQSLSFVFCERGSRLISEVIRGIGVEVHKSLRGPWVAQAVKLRS